MGTKKCSKCGKEKSYDNFYIQHKEMNQYGASDPRSYRHNCKECCSSSAKKQREKDLEYTHGFYFIYFIYNHNNELIYIGKTNDLYNRILQHHKNKKINKDNIKYIDIEILESLCDASVREIYYINKYKPTLNQRDVFEGVLTTTINEYKKKRIQYNKDTLKEDINKIVKKLIDKKSNKLKDQSELKKYSKPILKIDPETKEILEKYDTCKEAETKNNIAASGVSRAAKSGGKAGGFYWVYLNEEDKDTDRFKN